MTAVRADSVGRKSIHARACPWTAIRPAEEATRLICSANGSSSRTTRCTRAVAACSRESSNASFVATRRAPTRLTKSKLRRAIRSTTPLAAALLYRARARKARSRDAAPRALGLNADASASTRSKQVHRASTRAWVAASSALELAWESARTVNSHANQRRGLIGLLPRPKAALEKTSGIRVASAAVWARNVSQAGTAWNA